MDLLQRKLTKAEWDSIEVPVSVHEQRIIELIKCGFHDVQIKKNYTMSLLKYLKISYTDAIDNYVYTTYLYPSLAKLYKKYGLGELTETGSKGNNTTITLKKADIIRFNNTEKQITEHKESMFEFVLLALLENMLKLKYGKKKDEKYEKKKGGDNDKWLFYYYTLQIITKYNVELFNAQLREVFSTLLAKMEQEVDMVKLLGMSYENIERNDYLLKYADETLYDHQKQLFTLCKRPAPKLVLYIAPTGTGKTLSPLGLSEHYKIIFVCAARHVGLALAKSAISAHKKVAFAFGCNDAEDIRLHYFAAKEYTKNKKSGGIGKVDNSVGDNVEIIICDLQSYLPAMYYMLAFNPKENIILYWDEPTITLDSVTALPLHDVIRANWSKNLIPNIVLSSATLPRREEILETISSFTTQFIGAEIHEIISYDCKKTIPMINKEGFVEMPHYLSCEYLKILEIVAHTQKYKTLLRYIDLSEAVKFILYINENDYIKKRRYAIAQNFPTSESVTMLNIKNYYLELLGSLVATDWTDIYDDLIEERKQKQVSNIHIVTKDAHTLTDGPTIFLADDVDKIGKFYIQSAGIPDRVLKEIMSAITFNTTINEKVAVLEKDFQDGTNKDEGKEKKMGDAERLNPEMKRLMNKIDAMKAQIRTVMLDLVYVPNTQDHLYKYASGANVVGASASANGSGAGAKPFACDISEYIVEKIMLIDDIEDHWKLLLMMGIGAFSSTAHKSDRYTEIMKTLAQEQKLFMIIASSDYIYGTNYQFCHGYIGKDLENMSQEKCIQSMGRIGRNKLQHDYSIRFRDNALIAKLFCRDENKPEVKNMNMLFC